MSTDAESLYQAALQLPEDERIELAGRLLEGAQNEFDPEWEAAWGEEIARRIEEMDSGKVEPVPWTEVQRLMKEARDGARKS